MHTYKQLIFINMNAKAILKDIKKILFESDEQPEVVAPETEVKEEVKEEAPEQDEQKEEAPVPNVVEEKIAALETKVEEVAQQLSKAIAEKESVEAKLTKNNEGIAKIIELVEGLMDVSTADPSDAPKESFKKHLAESKSQQISKFQKGFELLNNNKKI